SRSPSEARCSRGARTARCGWSCPASVLDPWFLAKRLLHSVGPVGAVGETGDATEDFVRSLDPLEGPRVVVRHLDELFDRAPELNDARVRAALELARS